MLPQTDNSPQEQLALQSGAKDTHKQNSSELIERHPVEDTPFTIIGHPDKGYFLAMGMHRLTDYCKTKQEVEEAMQKQMWKIIITLVAIVTDRINDEKLRQSL